MKHIFTNFIFSYFTFSAPEVTSSFQALTLTWVSYIEVCFKVRWKGCGKIPPSLKLGRIMLETSFLARDDTLNFSCTKKLSVEGYNIGEKKLGYKQVWAAKNWVTFQLSWFMKHISLIIAKVLSHAFNR